MEWKFDRFTGVKAFFSSLVIYKVLFFSVAILCMLQKANGKNILLSFCLLTLFQETKNPSNTLIELICSLSVGIKPIFCLVGKKNSEGVLKLCKEDIVCWILQHISCLGETILNICQQANHPACGDKVLMNCEEGSPEQAKFAMQSGRPAAACGTKQCATGGFTFPCFFALFCVKSVTQVTDCTLTMWYYGISVWGGYGRRCCPQKGSRFTFYIRDDNLKDILQIFSDWDSSPMTILKIRPLYLSICLKDLVLELPFFWEFF